MTTSGTSRPSSSSAWALWLLITVLFSTLIAACVAALKYVTARESLTRSCSQGLRSARQQGSASPGRERSRHCGTRRRKGRPV